MKTIITVTDYNEFQPNSIDKYTADEVVSAINLSYTLLDAECGGAITKRWDATIGQEGYLTPEQKEHIKNAFLIQTQYVLMCGMDFSNGSENLSLGSMSMSSNRPNRNLISQQALKELQLAGIWYQTDFVNAHNGGRGCYHYMDELQKPLWIDKPLPESISNHRYVWQFTKNPNKFNKILMYDSQGWINYLDPNTLQIDFSNLLKSSDGSLSLTYNEQDKQWDLKVNNVSNAFTDVSLVSDGVWGTWKFKNALGQTAGYMETDKVFRKFTIYGDTHSGKPLEIYTNRIKWFPTDEDTFVWYFPYLQSNTREGTLALVEDLGWQLEYQNYLKFNPTSHPQQGITLNGILYNGNWYVLPQGGGGDATTLFVDAEVNYQTGEITFDTDSILSAAETYYAQKDYLPIIKLHLTVTYQGQVVQEGEYTAIDSKISEDENNQLLWCKFIVQGLEIESGEVTGYKVQQFIYKDSGTQVGEVAEWETESFNSSKYYDSRTVDGLLEDKANQTDLDALEGRVDDVEGDVDTLKSTVATHEQTLTLKQNITDNGLNTVSKTVVGAINEVLAQIDSTGAIVISAEDNQTFASTDAQITANGELTDIEGSTYTISELPVGITIYVIENEYPDRWLSLITGTQGTFNAISEKVDLSNYYNKGEVDSKLSLKANLSEVNNLTARVSDNEQDIANLETTTAGLASSISAEVTARTNADTALGNRLTTAEGDIDNVETRVGTAETNIDDLGEEIGNLNDDVADLQEATETLETDVAAIKPVIKTITAHETINTYEVPTLSVEDVTNIYNAVVAGRTTLVHFDPDSLGITSDFLVEEGSNITDIGIKFLFQDSMILTYTIAEDPEDPTQEVINITYKEIGGSGEQPHLYSHIITFTHESINYSFIINTPDNTAYNKSTLKTYLRKIAGTYSGYITLPLSSFTLAGTGATKTHLTANIYIGSYSSTRDIKLQINGIYVTSGTPDIRAILNSDIDDSSITLNDTFTQII